MLDLQVSCARALHDAAHAAAAPPGASGGAPRPNIGSGQPRLAAAAAAAAAKLVMDALRRSGQSHPGALLLFAEMALARGQAGDSARVALRLLPGAPADARVKAALATALQVGAQGRKAGKPLHTLGSGQPWGDIHRPDEVLIARPRC
jgi:hypothetical protein